MRNQVLYSMLGMAALFLVNGCTKQQAEPVLELSQSTVTIGAAGGSGSVSYKVTNPVSGAKPSVKAEENNWVSDIAVSDKAITFNVAENMETASRSVKLTVSYPNAKETEFTIEQAAAEPVPAIKLPELEDNAYAVAGEGGSCSVKYTIENPVDGQTLTAEVSNDVTWITNVAVDTDAITFDVARNYEEAPRTGSITLSYEGAITVDLKVNQAAAEPIEYTVNKNWTLAYAGREVDPQYGLTDYINVDVTAGTDSYIVGVVTVDEFNEYGIEAYAEEMIAYYQEMLDYYEEDWSALLETESSKAAFEPLDPSTEWYGVAFGVDFEGHATGLYALTEPFTPEVQEPTEEYNKWLGYWKVVGSDKVENVIWVQPDQNNYTYKVFGWQFGSYSEDKMPAIPASFNQDGSMTFQTASYGYIDAGSHGTGILSTYGIINYSGAENIVTGSYPIGTAELNSADAGTLTGEQVTISGGSSCDIIGMEYIVTVEDGIFGYDYKSPRFPATLTKTEAPAPTPDSKSALSGNDYKVGIMHTSLQAADNVKSGIKSAKMQRISR